MFPLSFVIRALNGAALGTPFQASRVIPSLRHSAMSDQVCFPLQRLLCSLAGGRDPRFGRPTGEAWPAFPSEEVCDSSRTATSKGRSSVSAAQWCATALQPRTFTWVNQEWFTWLLGLLMFSVGCSAAVQCAAFLCNRGFAECGLDCQGLTTSIDDFRTSIRNWLAVVGG